MAAKQPDLMRFVENLAMKKSLNQIIEDKLSSNLRRSEARSDRANEAVREARKAKDANTKHGQRVIRQRQRAASKADASVRRHTKAKLDHEANKTIRNRLTPLRKSRVRHM